VTVRRLIAALACIAALSGTACGSSDPEPNAPAESEAPDADSTDGSDVGGSDDSDQDLDY
jgi:hypothetical protein